MLTFMCELAEAVDATHTRGGVGWDVNVHVNLQGGKLTFM